MTIGFTPSAAHRTNTQSRVHFSGTTGANSNSDLESAIAFINEATQHFNATGSSGTTSAPGQQFSFQVTHNPSLDTSQMGPEWRGQRLQATGLSLYQLSGTSNAGRQFSIDFKVNRQGNTDHILDLEITPSGGSKKLSFRNASNMPQALQVALNALIATQAP